MPLLRHPWSAIAFAALTVFGGQAHANDVPTDPSKGKGGKTGSQRDLIVKVGDTERNYRTFAPKKTKDAMPLVYVFHGMGGTGDRIASYCGFEALAKKEGFLVVYPTAVNGQWSLRPGQEKDLDFFDAVHSKVCDEYNVDRNRVYATGMSMGGYFSNFVASQRSKVIASIAPHSGGLGALAFTGIESPRKYPVLVIHGDKDTVVPVTEGRRSEDAYKEAGHKVDYREFEGLGHRWATKHDITKEIWTFFQAHPMTLEDD